MSGLWLPPTVAPELRDRTREMEAALRGMCRWGGGILPYWNRELAKIDPHIQLCQAFEDAEWPGLWPGHYALIRWNPGAPPSVTSLHGPNGEFVEPTGQMLDRLRESDLQNTAAVEARRLLDERDRRAREADKQRDDEDRRQEVKERVQAVTRAQVSMNPDSPWTQSANGRRGRRR